MNKQLIIIGGVVAVAIIAVGVYQMNGFVDEDAQITSDRTAEQERFQRPTSDNFPPVEREQTEISLSDITVGQTVSVMGTTTNGTLVAETVMLMDRDFSDGPGGRGPFPDDGNRQQFQGGPGGLPEGGMPPREFGNRMIGEVTSIDSETLILTTTDGESLTVNVTSNTKYLSF